MYHLIIEHLGVRRCLATSEKDEFVNGLYIDCSQDHGCLASEHVRDITIICAGDSPATRRAAVYRD